MATFSDTLAWAEVPVPDTIQQMEPRQQEAVSSWMQEVVARKTEGFNELYQAISMIVKYIPHFCGHPPHGGAHQAANCRWRLPQKWVLTRPPATPTTSLPNTSPKSPATSTHQ